MLDIKDVINMNLQGINPNAIMYSKEIPSIAINTKKQKSIKTSQKEVCELKRKQAILAYNKVLEAKKELTRRR